MKQETTGLAQSVQVRLLRHARLLNVDPNLVLTRYAVERLLYRLSCSPHADRFVLKGAALMLAWLGETIRPTRDLDLLGFGDLSGDAVMNVFSGVCRVEVEPDGMTYEPASIRIAEIRLDANYGGRRVSLLGLLGSARLTVQVDIAVGDVVTPAPEWLDYPSLLDLPQPRLRAYQPETVIAEKVHAMVVLGARNSRMRDFFDVSALAERKSFNGDILVHALQDTFARRQTVVPKKPPLALTQAFAERPEIRTQWSAFLNKSGLATAGNFEQVVDGLASFLTPVIDAAAHAREFSLRWPPGGPWR